LVRFTAVGGGPVEGEELAGLEEVEEGGFVYGNARFGQAPVRPDGEAIRRWCGFHVAVEE